MFYLQDSGSWDFSCKMSELHSLWLRNITVYFNDLKVKKYILLHTEFVCILYSIYLIQTLQTLSKKLTKIIFNIPLEKNAVEHSFFSSLFFQLVMTYHKALTELTCTVLCIPLNYMYIYNNLKHYLSLLKQYGRQEYRPKRLV